MKSPADLRKAAILITALDSASGDALLEQMPPALAQRVRDTIMDLEDISAQEQQKVLAEFLGRSGGKKAPAVSQRVASSDVELEISPQAEARTQKLAAAPIAAPAESAKPFDFLRKIAGRHIAQVLENELPQAIAAVISSLEPEHAAEVLEALPTGKSIEALARMANLSDMSPVVLHDLAEGLKIQLEPHIQAQSIRKESLAGIQRVLSALDGERRKSLLATMGRQNSPLVKQLGYLAGDDAPASKLTTNHASLAESHLPSVTTPTAETHKISATAPPVAMPSFAEVAAPTEIVNEEDLPDLEELFFLPLAEVKHVFADVSPEVAILAMTGAEPRLLEKFLKRLPQALAEDLQYRLAHPGPVRLRDLDRARLQVRQSLNALFEEEDEEETSTASWSA